MRRRYVSAGLWDQKVTGCKKRDPWSNSVWRKNRVTGENHNSLITVHMTKSILCFLKIRNWPKKKLLKKKRCMWKPMSSQSETK